MTTRTSDCGCGGATQHVNPVAPAAVKAGAAADAKAAPAAATHPSTSPDTVALGGFRALNPKDGLFLRAEHLAAIQDYARALTRAAATGSGTGIVHGLGVTLGADSLEVSPGLAISPAGRLLLLRQAATIRLGPDAQLPPLGPDGFWRVEVRWAAAPSGFAPLYGSLCGDPCADGASSIQPWLDEGVALTLQPDTLPGLWGQDRRSRRNWLASAYFERERAAAPPWLVPAGAGLGVGALATHDWTDVTPLADDVGVPLAVLQRLDEAGTYQLDVWTARRLCEGPASQDRWRGHLGQRPWSVFLAQLLQFQAEFSGLPEGAAPLRYRVGPDPVRQQSAVLDALRAYGDKLVSPEANRRFKATLDTVKEAFSKEEPPGPVPPAAPPLPGELPPAGYVDANEHDAKSLEVDLRARLFGGAVDLRFRQVRADQVADEVLAAQHRDRIPLAPARGVPPAVDVLVPTHPADKPELHTEAYGWVAFVRRGIDPVCPEPPAPRLEPVAVHVLVPDWQEGWEELADEPFLLRLLDQGNTPMGTLEYPEGTWEFPGSEATTRVMKRITEFIRERVLRPVALVGLAGSDTRLPLATLRAALFGASLDRDFAAVPVYRAVRRGEEAIVIILARGHEG